MTKVLADHGDIYARCVVVFSSSKVGFEYIVVDVKTKEKSHKNLSSYGFWRRARDSNPRTGYSPLHDFQHIIKSTKSLDLKEFSVSNILIFLSPFQIFLARNPKISNTFRRLFVDQTENDFEVKY